MLERAKWKLTSQMQLLVSLHAAVKNRLQACCLTVEKKRPAETMIHLTSRHILYPSSTRTIDSKHWQPYCSLRATHSLNHPSPKICIQSFWIWNSPPPESCSKLGTKRPPWSTETILSAHHLLEVLKQHLSTMLEADPRTTCALAAWIGQVSFLLLT